VLVGDRIVSACPGAGPGGYGSIVTHARVETDGEASRVQPASAGDGTFELLLMRDTSRVQSEVAVAGSIRGVVVNTIAPSLVDGGAAADARATFAGSALATAARVEGAVHGGGAITSGLITGNVEVGNSGGAAVTCTPGTVRLSLSRLL
jgi:hypothetical protein